MVFFCRPALLTCHQYDFSKFGGLLRRSWSLTAISAQFSTALVVTGDSQQTADNKHLDDNNIFMSLQGKKKVVPCRYQGC